MPRSNPDLPPNADSMAAAARAGHPSALRYLTGAECRQVAADAADRLAAVGLICSRLGSVVHTERHGCRYRLAVRRDQVLVDIIPALRAPTRQPFRSAHDAVVSIAVMSGASDAHSV